VSSAEDSLAEAEELLAQLDRVRQRLDSTDDVDAVIEILGELNEITKKVEAAINEAKRRTEAEADAEP
jgi:predicted RND superfamily exporter protein